MRSAAAQTIHEYDLRPANGDIYVCDVLDKGGKMMKALREWEQRRGLTFSYKNRFIEPKSKKVEQHAKEKQASNRYIVAKPKRAPKRTEEEKRQLKNQKNREYRERDKEKHRERARKWRANLTPEQRAEVNRKLREWKAARKATQQQGGLRDARMPLPDTAVS